MTDEEQLRIDMLIGGYKHSPDYYTKIVEKELSPEEKAILEKEKRKEKRREIGFNFLVITGLIFCVLGVINFAFDIAAALICFVLWRITKEM